MRRDHQVLWSGLLWCLATATGSANLIYNFTDYPDLQDGHRLSGSITTTLDAPTDGLLTTDEILHWSVEVTGGTNPFSVVKTIDSPTEITGEVGITLEQITIGFPSVVSAVNEAMFAGGLATQAPALRYLRINEDPIMPPGPINQYEAGPLGLGNSWQASEPSLSGEPWVIATRARPVPEVSSVLSWGLGGLLITAWAIRRRAGARV